MTYLVKVWTSGDKQRFQNRLALAVLKNNISTKLYKESVCGERDLWFFFVYKTASGIFCLDYVDESGALLLIIIYAILVN